MSGHTPGPWVDGGCRRTMAGERRSIELRQGTPRGRLVAIVETVANARLVAAAPALLAALEGLYRSSAEILAEDGSAWTAADDKAWERARAAIARARGGK